MQFKSRKLNEYIINLLKFIIKWEEQHKLNRLVYLIQSYQDKLKKKKRKSKWNIV